MRNFEDIFKAKLSRRNFLKGSAAMAAISLLPKPSFAEAYKDIHLELRSKFPYQIVAGWGDKIGTDIEMGYNCDYVAYMPLAGNDSGLLCVNYETSDRDLMFPPNSKTGEEIAKEEMLAHGHSVVEIVKKSGKWELITDSKYNRRLNSYNTVFGISGPASQEIGTHCVGTLNNCGGGKTPWNTLLICEENFNAYFHGRDHQYGMFKNPHYEWYKYDARFADMNEAKKFGWVFEYDPYNPDSKPIKRTALGRFKHEGAATATTKDGRLAIYMGDDEGFQFIYKFVSDKKISEGGFDSDILDKGTLYAGKFDEEKITWLPIPNDELVNTRLAAKKLGATPMDRPEELTVHPLTGEIFVALSHNSQRRVGDAANPRIINATGHIIKLTPQDHGEIEHGWDIFLFGDENLACPDNLRFDQKGRLWITTDGMEHILGKNDGLFMVEDTNNPVVEQVLATPVRGEPTGIEFTPDGKTMFLSIQHPGRGSDYNKPYTRWPDFDESKPPRPAVIALDIS